jgi:hypothetical protein
MWIPGVANVAMRDVPPGLSGTASGVFNASRQVGTSVGLAILGAVEAGAATSAWGSHVAHLPGAARQAAIGQAHNVASARIGSATRALGAGERAAAEQAFSHGYAVAVLVAGFSSSLRRSSRYSGCVTTAGRSWTQSGLYQRRTPVPRRRRGSGHRRTGGHLAPALMIRSGRGYRAVATGRCHQTLVTLGGPALGRAPPRRPPQRRPLSCAPVSLAEHGAGRAGAWREAQVDRSRPRLASSARSGRPAACSRLIVTSPTQ